MPTAMSELTPESMPNKPTQTLARRALVLGAGVTGVATARYLQDQGYVVRVADDRLAPPGMAELEELLTPDQLKFGEPLESISLSGVDYLVVSPGLSRSLPLLAQARAEGLEPVSDIQVFLQQAQAPVVAVTGTNGKSTLVRMLEHLLKGAGKRVLAGGNLGPAALDLLRQPRPDFYLLELSSFQLEWLHQPALALAVITNITPDHLDRYDSFADYCAAKAVILGGAAQVVLNLNDAESRQLAMALPVATSVSWFGDRGDAQATARIALTEIGEVGSLLGRHNRLNAQAALTVTDCLGLTVALAADPWAGFAGLAHRLQSVAQVNDVRWVNDSKATNVGATLAAGEGLVAELGGRLVLVLGGDGKGQDFRPLRQLAPHLRAVITTGRDGTAIGELFAGLVPLYQANNMAAVVAIAADTAHNGDTVLLSPACASLDQYRDYQQRGDEFVKAVHHQLGIEP